MAVTGRYKSRALNYLVDQAQKLRSQAARTFRHATTGVTWGAQILLYPLYVAFQTSRVVGRRLTAAASSPRELIQLPEFPKSDEPLSRVLSLAQGLVDGDSVAVEAAAADVVAAELGDAEETAANQTVPWQPADPETLESLRSPAPIPQLSDEALQPQADLWEMTDDSDSSGAIVPQASAPLTSQRPNQEDIAEQESAEPQPAATALRETVSSETVPAPIAQTTTAMPRANAYFIRGVASNLGDRALTLVDNQNNLVPLSAEQQQQLGQQMVQEVADFSHRRRRYLKVLFERQRPLAPVKSDRDTLFPVVRWTRNLMGWMQRSPVALSINLFNETQLPPAAVSPPSLPPLEGMGRWATRYLSPEQQQQFALATLERVDAPLATLEESYAKRIEPGPLGNLIRRAAAFFGLRNRLSDPSSEQTSLGAAIGHAAGGTSGLAPTPWPSGLLSSSGESSSVSSPSASAAMVPTPSGPVVRIQQVGIDANSVIKAEPLVPETGAAVVANADAGAISLAPPQELTVVGVAAQRSSSVDTQPENAQSEGNAAALQTTSTQTIATSETGTAAAQSVSGDAESSSVPTSDAPLVTAEESPKSAPTWKPSYIETTATVTGYIKHPLEWLLEKLDRLLLRIEQAFAMIWRWFQAQFHPNR